MGRRGPEALVEARKALKIAGRGSRRSRGTWMNVVTPAP
jgi:hypothetical protein